MRWTLNLTWLRILLSATNITCLILSIWLIVLLAHDVEIDVNANDSQDRQAVNKLTIGMIALITLVVLITIIGSCGAMTNNTNTLYMYSVLITLIIIVQLIVGVILAVYRSWLIQSYTTYLNEYFYRVVSDDDTEIFLNTWDKIHKTFKCCAVEGPSDFTTIGSPIPLSCCDTITTTIQCNTYYTNGCEKMFLKYMESGSHRLLYIGLVFFITEVLGIIIALWLECKINSFQLLANRSFNLY